MKNKLPLLGLIILLFSAITFAIACDSTSEAVSTTNQTKYGVKPDFITKSSTPSEYSWTGNIEFAINTKEKEFTAYFVNGEFINWVIIQETDLNSVPSDGQYMVEIYKHAAVFTETATGKSYFYGIDTTESTDLFTELGPTKFLDYNLSGTGIIHNWADHEKFKDLNLTTVRNSGLSTLGYFHMYLGQVSSGGTDCDQGGEGSSSCSVGTSQGGGGSTIGKNCSVTCKTGYYACCNEGGFFTSMSCKCKKG